MITVEKALLRGKVLLAYIPLAIIISLFFISYFLIDKKIISGFFTVIAIILSIFLVGCFGV